MDRPIRAARQKAVKVGGVVGLHPTEEAAITKALRASLHIQKNWTNNLAAEPLATPTNLDRATVEVAPNSNSLQSSNCTLNGFPDTISHYTESKSLLSMTCISTVDEERKESSVNCNTVQMGQNFYPEKKIKCIDQSNSHKSKIHKAREPDSMPSSSETILATQKSPRTFTAQRKFTQNFGPVPIQKVFTQANTTPSDTPKTEDFISFLCLRDETLLLC